MGQESVGDLNLSLSYVLKQLSSLMRGSMEDVLRPLGLTVPQYACLELLNQNSGLSNSELARRAFVSRQSMNLVLRRLQERGLVARPESAPEGRALPSRLTGEGEDLVLKAGIEVRKVEKDLFSPLPEDVQQRIRSELAECMSPEGRSSS